MKKNEIQIGSRYIAKVSGRLTILEVLSVSQYGGWNTLNIRTKRNVHIRGCQRFRKPYEPKPF